MTEKEANATPSTHEVPSDAQPYAGSFRGPDTERPRWELIGDIVHGFFMDEQEVLAMTSEGRREIAEYSEDRFDFLGPLGEEITHVWTGALPPPPFPVIRTENMSPDALRECADMQLDHDRRAALADCDRRIAFQEETLALHKSRLDEVAVCGDFNTVMGYVADMMSHTEALDAAKRERAEIAGSDT